MYSGLKKDDIPFLSTYYKMHLFIYISTGSYVAPLKASIITKLGWQSGQKKNSLVMAAY